MNQKFYCGDVLVTYDDLKLKALDIDNVAMCVIALHKGKDVVCV